MTLAERLIGLSELLIAFSASPIPTHLFQTLADQAATTIDFDFLAICLKDADEQGYLVHSLAGLEPDATGPRVFGLGEGLVGRALESRRMVVTADLSTEPDAVAGLEGRWAALGLRAALIAPLRRGAEVVGALLFAARPPTTYTSDDLQVASLMAAGVAGALETSRAYQALADERSTLAAVVGSTQDAVLMVNQDGIVLLANPAVRAMLGVEPEAITGRPLLEAVGESPIRAVFEAGGPGTTDVPLADGRTAQASVVPVSTPYGEPVGLAAILRDVTLLKKFGQMKSEFVNTVSHDLKNPIMVISTTAELMLRVGASDRYHAARCQRIVQTATYMNELVGELLDLGKIESGVETPSEELDLVPLVTDVVAAIRPQAEAKEIAIAVDVPERALVTAIPARIKQAMFNLVGNAVKYTPAGGRATIALAETMPPPDASTPELVWSVTDTGIGIPAADLPYVFDKFYRVRNAATQDISGTGLGLAITRSIIETHGGRIWVESQEGKGSTFAFALPARQ
jgi:PAS domain S-box-containing protein